MILNESEREQLRAVITDLDKIAASQGQHSSTGAAIARNAADLRRILATATTTKNGRADKHPC